MSAAGFELRPAVPGDLAFIYANWLRSLRDEDRSALPDDLWYPAHREALSRVLADTRVAVVVACAPDNHDEILGFAAGVPGEILHWIHVLRVFRGRSLPLVPALLTAVGATEGVPAAWQMASGRALRNRPRPRAARRFYGPSTSSGSSAT